MKLENGLLIATLLLFCIGCQREVVSYRNGILQKDTDTGVTDVVEMEEADEVEEKQFPDEMLIPDAGNAVLPEISHLHKYFSRKTDEFSEIEKIIIKREDIGMSCQLSVKIWEKR